MKPLCLAILFFGFVTGYAANTTVTQGFVAGAGKIEIHYRQAGPRRAAHTLLLIPGWRVSSLIWTGQLRYFAGLGDRVVAIDSRSQGGSTVVYSHNTPEYRAQDIHEVIAHLHLTHVTLVGWSQGAQDVAAYVNQYGTAAVDDLVLVDSPVSDGPDDVSGNPKFLETILRGIALYSRHPRDYSLGMMHAIISVPVPTTTLDKLVAASMKTPTDVGISMLLQDLFSVDRRPYLKKFNKPTLVIASGRSPLLEVQKTMAANLPMSRFVVIHHASHAVFFDQPTVFDQQLEKLITSVKAN